MRKTSSGLGGRPIPLAAAQNPGGESDGGDEGRKGSGTSAVKHAEVPGKPKSDFRTSKALRRSGRSGPVGFREDRGEIKAEGVVDEFDLHRAGRGKRRPADYSARRSSSPNGSSGIKGAIPFGSEGLSDRSKRFALRIRVFVIDVASGSPLGSGFWEQGACPIQGREDCFVNRLQRGWPRWTGRQFGGPVSVNHLLGLKFDRNFGSVKDNIRKRGPSGKETEPKQSPGPLLSSSAPNPSRRHPIHSPRQVPV